MNFNQHLNLIGQHAFLSASQHSWLNWDLEKLALRYKNAKAAEKGTRLHELAKEHIELGIRMPKTKNTLSMYINDAIGFRMTPEQPLYYSENCFGTADAISFRDNFLRIHDYKSGETPVSMDQLKIYSALFCLEYRMDPHKLSGIELRIYQSNERIVCVPEPDEISDIMEKIVIFDKELQKIKMEDVL